MFFFQFLGFLVLPTLTLVFSCPVSLAFSASGCICAFVLQSVRSLDLVPCAVDEEHCPGFCTLHGLHYSQVPMVCYSVPCTGLCPHTRPGLCCLTGWSGGHVGSTGTNHHSSHSHLALEHVPASPTVRSSWPPSDVGIPTDLAKKPAAI